VSYILDALKKSDSERQQRQGPTLATVQHQQYAYHRSNRSWLMLLLAALVFALASAGFWLYQLGYLQLTTPRSAIPLSVSIEPGADSILPSILTPTAPPATVVAPIDRPVPVDSHALADGHGPVNSTTPVVVAPPPEPVREHSDIMPPPGTILELGQLPASLRAGVPPLDFSLHVYSTRRDQRSIIINNRMMREGETINPELALSAITPDGVVMKYRNEYFRVSILDNW
jgi:general secretion pathway protein B